MSCDCAVAANRSDVPRAAVLFRGHAFRSASAHAFRSASAQCTCSERALSLQRNISAGHRHFLMQLENLGLIVDVYFATYRCPNGRLLHKTLKRWYSSSGRSLVADIREDVEPPRCSSLRDSSHLCSAPVYPQTATIQRGLRLVIASRHIYEHLFVLRFDSFFKFDECLLGAGRLLSFWALNTAVVTRAPINNDKFTYVPRRFIPCFLRRSDRMHKLDSTMPALAERVLSLYPERVLSWCGTRGPRSSDRLGATCLSKVAYDWDLRTRARGGPQAINSSVGRC